MLPGRPAEVCIRCFEGRPEEGLPENRDGGMPAEGLLFNFNDRQKRHWKPLKKWHPVSFVLILIDDMSLLILFPQAQFHI